MLKPLICRIWSPFDRSAGRLQDHNCNKICMNVQLLKWKINVGLKASNALLSLYTAKVLCFCGDTINRYALHIIVKFMYMAVRNNGNQPIGMKSIKDNEDTNVIAYLQHYRSFHISLCYTYQFYSTLRKYGFRKHQSPPNDWAGCGDWLVQTLTIPDNAETRYIEMFKEAVL